MNLEVRPLTPELAEDYIDFFRHRGFADHTDWSWCYCLTFCLTPEDDRASEAVGQAGDSEKLHCHMSDLVRRYVLEGRLHGYLAYHDGRVVGWCNANGKGEYRQLDGWYGEINAFLMAQPAEGIKAVTCFLIDPDHRGQGVATALLDRVVADAVAEGYAAIEGYPRAHEERDPYDFTGPMSLYIAAGFTQVAEGPGVTVMRKGLRRPGD